MPEEGRAGYPEQRVLDLRAIHSPLHTASIAKRMSEYEPTRVIAYWLLTRIESLACALKRLLLTNRACRYIAERVDAGESSYT